MTEEIVFDCLHAEIINYCLDDKENDFSTLEYIGFTTGYRLIERLTRDVNRFKDELETIKFICTDFWTLIYKKQVDNLRTNNQGSKQLQHAPKFVAFTCGLVRGALSNLGITSTVTAEVQSIPACRFHIEVNRN
ncbi:trafficking protein particle complex subunit 6b isoform X2 [Glossina fuscipes]|uniref:Trafficking protein particle complex subunit 6b isoform X2 n=1 Tax=Glossina fuscipes TaxID=7396 RepID=A0A8U0WI79_9MUSC|nr:trafficking protein particle complex subunit 6b isoform X2 [Glossina fuscipes]